MADVKQLFLHEINELDFPESIKNFLKTALPADPGAPGSVEAAIIANGHLSNYLIAILNQFVGITPIELFLRAGQLNATLQSIALSGLELAKAANPHDFEIYSPNPNQEFPEGGEVRFGVQINTSDPVESVACRLIKDGDEFSRFALPYDGNHRYVKTLKTLDPDPYQAEITVTWVQGNYSQMQAVDFFIMEA